MVFMTLHFPDDVATNLLTIDVSDPKSGTAEFKACAVRVERARAAMSRAAASGEGRALMDIRPIDAEPTADERAAVDALLGAPRSAWDGGPRGDPRDAHVSPSAAATRARCGTCCCRRLQALQARVGWISEGGLGYVCDRLNVPPADAWGVATFYALLATSPRPRRVVHVCDDIACKCRGADEVIAALERSVGPAAAARPRAARLAVPIADRRSGCGRRASASAIRPRRHS